MVFRRRVRGRGPVASPGTFRRGRSTDAREAHLRENCIVTRTHHPMTAHRRWCAVHADDFTRALLRGPKPFLVYQARRQVRREAFRLTRNW